MKTTAWLVSLLFLSTLAEAQISNDNTLTTQIDGKEFKTAPRRIRFGAGWWMTANTVNPDKSLRFFFVNFMGKEIPEVGSYRIVDEDYSYKRKNYEDDIAEGKYKGLAVVKYVEETRSPRMEFRVGKSLRETTGTVEITGSSNQYLEGTFNVTLAGQFYKEKAGTTVFGGVGRIINKMEDRALTSATGYDFGNDPDNGGYRKMDKKEDIVITNGTFKLKLLKDEK